MSADFGCVLLTMGKRPDELHRALTSLLNQQHVTMDIVIVGNGYDPSIDYKNIKTLFLQENFGIPAGRNAGVEKVSGNYLFFLDDDVVLKDPHFLFKNKKLLEEEPKIGLIQPRVDTLDKSPSPRRWIPRLIKGKATRSSKATALWEGATVIRTDVFEKAGRWPDNFFYAHEGVELCWQVWNQGYVAWYAGDIAVSHPAIQPTRHEYFYRLNARNRVWLAKRNLPFPFSFIYPLTHAVMSLFTLRGREARKSWREGFMEGLKSDAGKNRKLTFRAIRALTFALRPPII
ncbi:MAG: glycosyltransferase family 2 protein [Candidatus Nanopelagicales bacterium]